MSLLWVENLVKTVTLGNLKILDEVNMCVEAGEMVAIVGASGSGKSTLLALLAGLDLPTEGKVYWDGQDIFLLDENQRAQFRNQYLGFIFQNFQLLDHLNALENVSLALEIANRADGIHQAKEMLIKVGLGQHLKHYPKQMSGGEQQRVAIARALVLRPKIVLADEPTGNLDHANGRLVMDLLLSMSKDLATTLLLVTHNDELANVCDRKYRMHQGRLAELKA
ncbi:MAG: ABC transporter ATP-binding protein [Gammaproteobacteria bacterium]|nr:ABC transporter ATP-binding protein [Gammaproteobacteria bacterium]